MGVGGVEGVEFLERGEPATDTRCATAGLFEATFLGGGGGGLGGRGRGCVTGGSKLSKVSNDFARSIFLFAYGLGG